MRILLISESYWPNSDGGAVFERRLVQGLIGLGHTVSVWAPGPRYSSFVEHDGASTIFREKSLPFVFNLRYHISYFPWTSAAKVFEAAKPDVIHLNNQGVIWYAGRDYARRHNIPIVATNHFMPENWVLNLPLGALRQPVTNLLWRMIVNGFNRCNYVTAPTQTALDLLINRGLKTPHRPVSNGVDTGQFHPQKVYRKALLDHYNIPETRRIILYAGRLEGEKRINVIIDALPELKKQHDIHLVLVGAGIMHKSLVDQAKNLGLSDRVTLTGFIEEQEKIDWYNVADLFAIASVAELQSLVTLEAMACGLPIIAVDAIALKELCHDGVNGYLVQPDNPAAIAAATHRILSDDALRKQFGQESMKIVQRSHSTQVMFETYESIYKHLIKQETT